MGFKDAIVSLVGDFVELRRNPEFRSRNELATTPVDENDDSQLFRRNRRHSLNITVGTSGPTTEHLIRQRIFTEKKPVLRTRRHSALPKLSSVQSENRSPSPSESAKADLSTPTNQNRATDRRSSEPHNLRIPPNFGKDRPILSDSDSDTDELVLRRSLNLRRRREDLRHSVALSEHTIQEEWEAEDQEQSPENGRLTGRTVISINH
ncbi:unnamed protein product [Bursaphelenchus xylophilus]|uniref:(pine wood nematode) hypothetical protein n=1 Tax=Bursaphelenchus xylophilus TaxID=6326 RepID=A0A1I7RNX5_BURXY|nr:unnamed protein product [Bursaphelenchus xylophilus]CAG9124364.1 unnamed protein product [Bursaphelenchus xylophilus]